MLNLFLNACSIITKSMPFVTPQTVLRVNHSTANTCSVDGTAGNSETSCTPNIFMEIKNWNQLPAEALGTFPYKPKIFRNRVRKAIINGVK
jgi:hypothetical protein